jgi:glycosyltransferase involved in cell wall biosynthesis
MKHHVLFIGLVWPEPDSSAAGVRMLQLVNSFLEQGYCVSFACSAARSEFSYPLESIGVSCHAILLNDSSFDSFIETLAPTMVVFDRYITEEQYGWRVSETCPNALRILDTEDLHCLRKARHRSVKENRSFTLEDLLVEETAKREIASILRCDITWIISEFEMEILRNVFKLDASLIAYLPMWVDAFSTKNKSFYDTSNFSFVGNFLHDPNWDAVLYLKKEIWPLIRKQLPQAEVHIYGAYPSQKVLDLHNEKEGFIVKGRANSLDEVYNQTRVFLAPLRFGAGIKGKLMEAMLRGVPSVTTSVGAESMHGDHIWNGSIEDQPDLVVQAAVALYTNQRTWDQVVERGYQILNLRYVKKDNSFIIDLEIVYDKLEKHRKANFMGSLLQQQQFQSTKFMSKWIELKNQSNN